MGGQPPQWRKYKETGVKMACFGWGATSGGPRRHVWAVKKNVVGGQLPLREGGGPGNVNSNKSNQIWTQSYFTIYTLYNTLYISVSGWRWNRIQRNKKLGSKCSKFWFSLERRIRGRRRGSRPTCWEDPKAGEIRTIQRHWRRVAREKHDFLIFWWNLVYI